MRTHVNRLVCVLRAPGINSDATAVRSAWLLSCSGRRLHSDAPSVAPAAVKAVPAAEARPPLADLHGRRHDYLRISLTERCNLRCQYCMPAEGVPLSARGSLLARDELARLVRAFAALGVRKVRLTGGEPTIRKDLPDIIQDISQIEGIRSVSITTNGLVLTRKLPALQRAGLAAINISLDSLRAERYENMARRSGLQRVLAGVDLALQLGYRPVKINTVLMKGFNDDEICDFVEYTREREVEVRFIEFMPFSGNKWDDGKMVPHRVALRRVTDRYPDAMPCLPRPNDTARVWQVPGYSGRVGFISSMTQNFCSSCNRLRLTADGNLKVCLFGSAEVSLRDALRGGATDGDLETLIRTALYNKKPQHAESRPNGEPADDSDRGLDSTADRLNRDVETFTAPPAPAALGTTRSASPSRSTGVSARSTVVSSRTASVSLGSTNSSAFILPEATITYSRLATSNAVPTTVLGRATSSTNASPMSMRPSSVLMSAVSLASKSLLKTSVRAFSTQANDGGTAMTHLDDRGRARMVDVTDKAVTSRIAEAECSLRVGARLLRLLRDARLPKGDALTVAQIAGIVGAKKTSDLIPMCHPLPLDCVRVNVDLPKGECKDGGDITVHCEVKVTSRTGVEMEALTGAAVAALALYDMCKSVDKHMVVMNLRVVRKSGGRSGEWPRQPPPELKVRAHDTTPIKPDETFAPTNFMHF